MHQAKSNRVGQIAKPAAKLNEATNPAQVTISIVHQERDLFATKRKETATAAITKEFSELNGPDRVMASRPNQKLPTLTTSVAMTLAVRPTVLSCQSDTN